MTASLTPAFVTAEEAAALIPTGANVAITGSGGGLLEPSAIFPALRQRFESTGGPSDLTLIHSLGIGHSTGKGLELWADPSLVKRVIGGHWAWSPTLQKLAAANEIEAYAWPAGVISLLLREIGARRPGLFTRTGLHTFVDPRHGGGRCNQAAAEELVSLVEVAGEAYLHFPPLTIDIGLIRGTAADARGNLTCVDEPAALDVLAVAQAAKASGGFVIAQVREVVDRGSIDPRHVDVPGCLVDKIVVVPDQWQTYESVHNPAYAGVRASAQSIEASWKAETTELPLARRLVAGRAAREVRPPERTNIGFGMAADVVDVLSREGLLDGVELLIEQGTIGGIPVGGELFGVSVDFDALFDSPTQFDLFGSGVLDRSYLGMAEVDRHGSVNVSLLQERLIGPGGFIDISQNAAHVVFCGTFRAKGLELAVEGDELRIVNEGTIPKFVSDVQHVTYSAPFAREEGRTATYVTERAVFTSHPDGLELIEVVAGIDIERDILNQMEFEPVVNSPRVVGVTEYGLRITPGSSVRADSEGGV